MPPVDQRIRTIASVGAIFLLLLASSCAEQALTRKRAREFARLNHALTRVQKADRLHKKGPLAELRQTQCRLHCSFRDDCVRAYEAHLEAIVALQKAKTDLDHESTEDLDVAAALIKARLKLDQARPLVDRCVTRQGQLERAVLR